MASACLPRLDDFYRGSQVNCNGTLDETELRAVSAVIAYVTHTYKASEETVVAFLTTAFKVESVRDIPHDRYEDAILYLVNLNIDKAMN